MKTRINRVKIIVLIICMLVGMISGISVNSQTVYAMTTQSEAVNWIRNQKGKSIDIDGAYGAQCVDLIAAYFEYLGVPWRSITVNYAKDYTSRSLPGGFQRIQGASIQAGDIVIWTGENTGHVALALSDNNIVEQNYNSIKSCIENSMHWSNYWGVIRPDFNPESPPVPVIPQGSRMETGGERVISDGDYHIVSALGGSRYNPGLSCLTIGGLPESKNISGANAELGSVLGLENHVFTVTWLENGFYKVKLKDSDNQYLDVYTGSTQRGTNVQQFEEHGGDNQQWCIRETEDGNGYTIQARCSGFYLDVYGGYTSDGTNIQLWEGNGSSGQRWYFIPWAGGSLAKQEIEDGEYQIVSDIDYSKALHTEGEGVVSETNIHIWPCQEDSNSIFNVKWLGDGYYEITDKKSELSLDVYDAENKQGTNVQLGTPNGGVNQQWLIRSDGDGGSNIITKCNGLYLDVAGSDNVNVWAGHGGSNQKWHFVPLGSSIGRTIEDGEYRIVSQADTGKFLSSKTEPSQVANGTNIELNSNNEDLRDRFEIKYVGNGCYIIVNKSSGYAVDAADNGSKNGSNVQLWEQNFEDVQKWMFKPNEEGGYQIISKCCGLYLDAGKEQMKDGSISQNWKLVPCNQKVDVESIRMEKVELTMMAGSQEMLKVMFSPQDATDKTLTWKSSNPSVVEVDANGCVTAKTPGTAVVIATTSNGKTEFCQVAVMKENQPSIHIHSYGAAWKINDEKHWKECECGDRSEESLHEFTWIIDHAATTETVGLKHKECGICGSRRNEGTVIDKLPFTHTHSYGTEWKTNNEKHWRECECGDKSEESLHEFTWSIDRLATEETIGIKHEECETCSRRRNEGTIIEKMPTCQHVYQISKTPATIKKDGTITEICSKCENEKSKTTIYAIDCITLSRISYVYNGKTKKPSVMVKDTNGKMLRDKVDYTVYYPEKAKNVGSYTVTITLKGNYSGKVKRTFDIVPKGTAILKMRAQKKGFTIKWKKQKKQISGYEIAYSTNNKFLKKNTKTVTVKKNKIISKSISKLKAKKKFYVKIRTYKTVRKNGKLEKIYSVWSKVRVVTTKK